MLEPPGDDDVTVISHAVKSLVPPPPPPADDVPANPAPLMVLHTLFTLDAPSVLLTASDTLDSGPTAGVSLESTTVDSLNITPFEFDGPDVSVTGLGFENCTKLSGLLGGGIGGLEAEAVVVFDGRESVTRFVRRGGVAVVVEVTQGA